MGYVNFTTKGGPLTRKSRWTSFVIWVCVISQPLFLFWQYLFLWYNIPNLVLKGEQYGASSFSYRWFPQREK